MQNHVQRTFPFFRLTISLSVQIQIAVEKRVELVEVEQNESLVEENSEEIVEHDSVNQAEVSQVAEIVADHHELSAVVDKEQDKENRASAPPITPAATKKKVKLEER